MTLSTIDWNIGWTKLYYTYRTIEKQAGFAVPHSSLTLGWDGLGWGWGSVGIGLGLG